MLGPMLMKTKQNCKNLKNENFKKKKKEKCGLEIWWIGNCPQNLAKFGPHVAISEKPESMDDGCPHVNSSSAV